MSAWVQHLHRMSGVLTPEVMHLHALTAAIPGEGVDLELLLSLSMHFSGCTGFQARQAASEALTAGVLRRLDSGPERSCDCGRSAPRASGFENEARADILQEPLRA